MDQEDSGSELARSVEDAIAAVAAGLSVDAEAALDRALVVVAQVNAEPPTARRAQITEEDLVDEEERRWDENRSGGNAK